MIEQGLVSYLEGLSTAAGSRVYPIALPQDPAMPAITYNLESDDRQYTFDGHNNLVPADFQIDAWGETYLDAKALMAEMVSGIKNVQNQYFGLYWVNQVRVNAVADVYEDAVELYRSSMSVTVVYRLEFDGYPPVIQYDFTKNMLTPIRLKSGATSFSRNSVAWAQAYDESSGNLVWTQMSGNVPCFHGLRWTGTAWTPYKTDGSLISAATRRGLRLQTFALTNSVLYSRDFTQWTDDQTPIVTSDSNGFDGATHNGSIEDDSTTVTEFKKVAITVPNDSNSSVFRIRVKKNATPLVYPELGIDFTEGTAVQSRIVFDPSDGNYVARSGFGNYDSVSVIDDVDYYIVGIQASNNATGNTTCTLIVTPAFNADGSGAVNNAATGTTVFDQCELFLNKTIEEVKYAEPIVTTGAAATRLADAFVPGVISGNWNQNAGMVLAGWEPLFNGDLAIGIVTDAIMYKNSGNSKIFNYDGTNVANYPAGTMVANTLYHTGARHNAASAKKQIVHNQDLSGESAYDGDYPLGSDIQLGLYATFPIIYRYLEIYDNDRGQNWIAERQGILAP